MENLVFSSKFEFRHCNKFVDRIHALGFKIVLFFEKVNGELVRPNSLIKNVTCIFIVICCCSVVGYTQSAKEVVEKYFSAVSNGNFENWLKIKSAYLEIDFASEFENQIQFGPRIKKTFKIYRVWPDKSTSELYYDSMLVNKSYHVKNKSFLVTGGGAVMPVSPGPYEQYFEFDPILIKKVVDKSKKIELIGIKDTDSIKCYDVKIVTKDLVWHFYFNVDSFLLEYWSNASDGLPTETVTKVFDYKKFNECLIPMSEVKLKNGSPFHWATRKRVELNIEIDPSKFEYKDGELEKL